MFTQSKDILYLGFSLRCISPVCFGVPVLPNDRNDKDLKTPKIKILRCLSVCLLESPKYQSYFFALLCGHLKSKILLSRRDEKRHNIMC